MADETLNQEPQPEAETPAAPEEKKEEPSQPAEQPTEQPSEAPATEAQPVSQPTGGVKKRSPIMVLILGIITFGIYLIIWIFKTTKEMKSLGGNIPTPWLIFIPLINFYFIFKYVDAYAKVVKKDNNTIVWFLLWLFLSPVMVYLIQAGLNNYAQ